MVIWLQWFPDVFHMCWYRKIQHKICRRMFIYSRTCDVDRSNTPNLNKLPVACYTIRQRRAISTSKATVIRNVVFYAPPPCKIIQKKNQIKWILIITLKADVAFPLRTSIFLAGHRTVLTAPGRILYSFAMYTGTEIAFWPSHAVGNCIKTCTASFDSTG